MNARSRRPLWYWCMMAVDGWPHTIGTAWVGRHPDVPNVTAQVYQLCSV